MYNVFLSGGGLKGAYQYGFFKELYKQWPDIPIKKVYAVSVGAMNSAPIVTRRMNALDQFWNNPDVHPFDTIVHDWQENKTLSNRAMAYFIHGSVFKGIKREPYEAFLDDLDQEEWRMIREKLVIISFDKIGKKTIMMPCASVDWFNPTKPIIDAIESSSLYPGLFNAHEAIRIDGIFANVEQLALNHPDEKWLCLDLQNVMQGYFKENKEAVIYNPDISQVPILRDVAALFSNRYVINHLILNGKEHAHDFVNNIHHGLVL